MKHWINVIKIYVVVICTGHDTMIPKYESINKDELVTLCHVCVWALCSWSVFVLSESAERGWWRAGCIVGDHSWVLEELLSAGCSSAPLSLVKLHCRLVTGLQHSVDLKQCLQHCMHIWWLPAATEFSILESIVMQFHFQRIRLKPNILW